MYSSFLQLSQKSDQVVGDQWIGVCSGNNCICLASANYSCWLIIPQSDNVGSQQFPQKGKCDGNTGLVLSNWDLIGSRCNAMDDKLCHSGSHCADVTLSISAVDTILS